MKSNFVRVSMLVVGAAAAYAQNTGTMKVEIPFGFNASGTSMPAGQYLVDTRTPTVVILRDAKQHVSAMVRAQASESTLPQTNSRLVFHRYGDQYFLSEIWSTGNSVGRQIPQTKQERALAQQLANPDRVIVAGVR